MAEAVRKVATKTAAKPTVNKSTAASAAPAPGVPQAKAAAPVKRPSRPAPVKLAPATPASPAARKSPARKPPRGAVIAFEQTPPESKPAKVKKAKLVRDSFTMPESEYAAIAALKKRCLNSGVAAKKSEILRAAISCFAKLDDAAVAATIQGLDVIKTGRPAKSAK
mgnify:CR=1 FL=1